MVGQKISWESRLQDDLDESSHSWQWDITSQRKVAIEFCILELSQSKVMWWLGISKHLSAFRVASSNAIEVSVYQSMSLWGLATGPMTFALSHPTAIQDHEISRGISHIMVQTPACASFQVTQICFGTGDLSREHVWSPSCGTMAPPPWLWLRFSPTTAAPLVLVHRSA